MRARVKLTAPWWTSLSDEEKKITLEKEKDGLGDTGYGIFLEDARVGYVYSVRDEKKTRWIVETIEDREFTDRFTAIRVLLHEHLVRQAA